MPQPAAPYAVVVGGVNVDIGGMPFGALTPGDSCPGRVRFSVGGVGQNIARNLRLLDVPVRFLTAFGWDENGARVERVCESAGIDLSSALRSRENATSVYLYIADSAGEMRLAVSDMAICDSVTPQYLSMHEEMLNRAFAVVLDTNIPGESVRWLAEHCASPLFADPVSLTKAEKLRPVLGKLHTLKPNRLEAELLSGVRIRTREDLCRAADALLNRGLCRVFISLGRDGVYAADGHEQAHLPCCPANLKNATGAGDAFLAALVSTWLDGCSLTDSARAAAAAAAIAVEGEETVNPAMSRKEIQRKLSEYPSEKS